MRVRGEVALLLGVVVSACYGTPRSSFPDAGHDGGAGVAGNAGAAGSRGTGGRAGASGSAGIAGGAGTGGSAGAGDGPCNPTCDATHACSGGRCLLADAQPCVTASQCASGACNPFYRDVDGDGYGTGQAVGFCTLITPPIGYASANGDCCDDASNIALAKLIHPSADFQTTSAGDICGGISWDYDCSGTIEKDTTTCSGCSPAPDCQCIVQEFPDASCGKTNFHTVCFLVSGGGTMSCGSAGSGAFTLACR